MKYVVFDRQLESLSRPPVPLILLRLAPFFLGISATAVFGIAAVVLLALRKTHVRTARLVAQIKSRIAPNADPRREPESGHKNRNSTP